GNVGFLHCIQMDTSVNAANQVVSVGADIAFDADPKFFACLVRFESSSVPTTLPTAYDVASMTQKLTLSDISDESKNYLDKAGITTACLRIKSKWTAGGK